MFRWKKKKSDVCYHTKCDALCFWNGSALLCVWIIVMVRNIFSWAISHRADILTECLVLVCIHSSPLGLPASKEAQRLHLFLQLRIFILLFLINPSFISLIIHCHRLHLHTSFRPFLLLHPFLNVSAVWSPLPPVSLGHEAIRKSTQTQWIMNIVLLHILKIKRKMRKMRNCELL